MNNSFEQLCINYCNEKLQWFFNLHIFEMVQKEVAEEAVGHIVEVSYRDNQPVLDLIEKKGGLLAMLDEEVRMPAGSDIKFLQKILSAHRSSGSKGADRKALLTGSKGRRHDSSQVFHIEHFAGQ